MTEIDTNTSFSDIYISKTETLTEPDTKKVILSDEAYAIGSLLEQIKLLFKSISYRIK
jgi:hypothetical protein